MCCCCFERGEAHHVGDGCFFGWGEVFVELIHADVEDTLIMGVDHWDGELWLFPGGSAGDELHHATLGELCEVMMLHCLFGCIWRLLRKRNNKRNVDQKKQQQTTTKLVVLYVKDEQL